MNALTPRQLLQSTKKREQIQMILKHPSCHQKLANNPNPFFLGGRQPYLTISRHTSSDVIIVVWNKTDHLNFTFFSPQKISAPLLESSYTHVYGHTRTYLRAYMFHAVHRLVLPHVFTYTRDAVE
eukprot:m.205112 g.205112  ORF g.205112 m.205112 type:complete len:125 (+) comp15012_c0_seq17:5075-5449(+)